ncbi:hypothetical protein BGZ67_000564, partial [Mortierella alpina]
LFRQVLKLRHYPTSDLLDLVRDVYEGAKDCVIRYGCLPQIKNDTRLLVVLDEAQFLGDEFNGYFQSMSTSDESSRPLLSPVLHALRDVGGDQLTLEKIMEQNEFDKWRALIEDTEDRLVAWEHRSIKGNLCHELNQKHKGVRRDKSVKTVLDILGLYFYRRCFWGENTLEIDSVNASLVERAFGRIKIVNHNAVTVVDEPFVFKAVENFFTATDPGFQVALKELMDRTGAASQGNIFEQYMMSVFSETFKSRRLSDWPHQPPISEMCPDLVGDVEIVGWKEPALLK